ncbi:MAG: VacJ family lipoprotein, partial [Pseudomonadota bacterium]
DRTMTQRIALRIALLLTLGLGGCAGTATTAPWPAVGAESNGGAVPEGFANAARTPASDAARTLASDAARIPPRGPEPIFSASRVVPEDIAAPFIVNDPWNGANRGLYRFNAAVDDVFLMPLVRGYRRFTPGFARTGVTNFFDNLDDIRSTINLALQGRPRRTGTMTLRFLSNTVLGLGGLFDVASRFGLPRYEEDFGQTLGRYGVDSGPYVVLPLFGPSSLRDAIGRAVDAGFLALIDPLGLNQNGERGILYYPLLVIDTRHTTAFQYFETGSPFEYALVRKLYTELRELEIRK